MPPKASSALGDDFRKEVYMKVKAMIVLLTLIVLVTGCSADEEINENNKKRENSVEFNTQSATVENESEYFKLYGLPVKFGNKLDENDFSWGDEKYTKNEESVDEVSWGGNKGSYIYTEPGYLYYTAKEYSDNYDSLLWGKNGDFREDFDEVTKGVTVIEGMTKQQAEDKVNSIVNKYGMKAGNVKSYPLNKNILKRLSRDYMSDEEYEEYLKDKSNEPMKRDFSTDDEVFLVEMSPMVGQYSLNNSDYDYGKMAYSGAIIWALVNKDKIIAFYADGIYEITSSGEKIDNIITREEAKSKLEEKYKDLILSDDVECKKVDIAYIAINGKDEGTCEFIPAYIFELQYPIKTDKQDQKDSIVYVTQKLLLDAENGKWIE